MSMADTNVRSSSATRTSRPRSTPFIVLDGLRKTFSRGNEHVEAVAGVDLEIEREEIVALIGPSGCGKSTLLHVIAGLYAPTAGRVLYGGAEVTSVNTAVGYMTQKETLLPWRTVQDNIALPLEITGTSKNERYQRAQRFIDQIGLAGFERKYPRELSGGMRRRAALARMLLYSPETLLLDEPFGALDAQLRIAMHDLLLGLYEKHRQTIVLVTHDLMEAVTLADRVVVLTNRPAKVAFVQKIPLARPRDVHNVRFTDKFKDLYDLIWERLRSQYLEDRL